MAVSPKFLNHLRRLVELSNEGGIDGPAARLQDADAVIIKDLIELLKRRGV